MIVYRLLVCLARFPREFIITSIYIALGVVNLEMLCSIGEDVCSYVQIPGT